MQPFVFGALTAKNRKAFVCVLKELDPKQVFTIRLDELTLKHRKSFLDKDSLLSIVAKFEKEPALTPEGPEASGLFRAVFRGDVSRGTVYMG